MSFDGKRILITGGLGFIGSNLARKLLQHGARVTLVDSLIPQYGGNFANIEDIQSELTINISDVRDPYAMQYLIKDKDFLFNLAGQTSHVDSMNDPFSDLEINATAQLSILESARKFNKDIRIVFASTRQIYGRPQYLPVDERHPVAPVDVNGVNKQAGEGFHLLYNQVYGISCCALRLTNVYGPGMRVKDARQTFLGIWIRNLLEKRPIQIFGDGLQLRDFNYVDDAVDAFMISAMNPAASGKIFNLGSREVISLKNLADILVGMNAGAFSEIIPFPPERKVIDIGDYYSNFDLAERVLGWSPKVTLSEGLIKTVEYYREHLPKYLD